MLSKSRLPKASTGYGYGKYDANISGVICLRQTNENEALEEDYSGLLTAVKPHHFRQVASLTILLSMDAATTISDNTISHCL